MGVPSKADEQRSAITHRVHFVYWCTIRGIINEIFPLIKLSPIGVIYMLAMYAVFLAMGDAISCRSIKSSSVTKYIGDIANFLRQFAEYSTRDVKIVGSSIAYQISSITTEMKTFEDIPNRREPWYKLNYGTTVKKNPWIASHEVSKTSTATVVIPEIIG